MTAVTNKCAARAAIAAFSWIGAACGSSPLPTAAESPAPAVARIPRFEAGDERIDTAGFVGLTLREHRDVGDRRFTLMAFAVGDTLTLGAMVRGSYQGNVRWTVAGRALTFRFDTDGSLRDVPIAVEGGGTEELTGRGAAFRGTAWINVDVPTAWLPPGGFLGLEFRADDGQLVVLPEIGATYRAAYVAPPPAEAATSRRS